MKLLYFHAKDLRLVAGTNGSQNKQKRTEQFLRERLGDSLPLLDTKNKLTESKNALLVFVCSERGDESLDLSRAIDDIIRARALLGVTDIVIGAFGHLSENVAEPWLARRIVDDLALFVQSKYSQTKTFPFGWDKSIDLHIPLHHFNVSFKSYSNSTGFWSSVADDFDRYMLETGHYAAQARLLDSLISSGQITGSVLDLCCGAGFAINYLMAKGYGDITGLDSSEKMREIARKRSSAFHIVCGKAEYADLLFNSQKFNVILAINAAAYVDLVLMLTRLPRIINQDSRFIIMEEDPFIPGFSTTSHPRAQEQLSLVHNYTIRDIEQFILAAGFRKSDQVSTKIDERHNLFGMVFHLV